MRALRPVFPLVLFAVMAIPAWPAAEVPVLPAPPTKDWVKTLFDSWKAPVPPRHLVDTVYYVGAIGVSSYLITTSEGHILLDTGFADTVPIIQRGVEQLGFKFTDIKIILSSHAHIDHTCGHALMRQLTGAQVWATAGDARVLESGGTDDFIPFPRDTILYAPVKVDRIIQDGERVTLGGVAVTAHLTPGHTRGATTWTMEVKESGQAYQLVFFSSASINSGTRLLFNESYLGIATDLERSFARFKVMPCDIFLAPHGGQFAMADKFARLDRGEGVRALVDPEGWRALIATAEKAYRDQLVLEKTLVGR